MTDSQALGPKAQKHDRRIVVMGVSGSGKSSIGEAVGAALDIEYLDGDRYHPQANIDKMSTGEPLDDDDRAGWLTILTDLIADYRQRGESLLLGCSALKRDYRDQLRLGDPDLIFLYLDGGFDVILGRMRQREHFFSADMLQSQFETLEPPTDDEAVRIDIDTDFDDVIQASTVALRQRLNKDIE